MGGGDEDPATHDLMVTVEDVLNGGKTTRRADLVVLATGIVPRTRGLPPGLVTDEFGFAVDGSEGLYAAGCAKRPSDVAASVRDGTGAELQALQSVVRGNPHG